MRRTRCWFAIAKTSVGCAIACPLRYSFMSLPPHREHKSSIGRACASYLAPSALNLEGETVFSPSSFTSTMPISLRKLSSVSAVRIRWHRNHAERYEPRPIVRCTSTMATPFLVSINVDRAEPHLERDFRVLEDGSDQDREPIAVPIAGLTLPIECRETIDLDIATPRAVNLIGPTMFRQIRLTSVVVWERHLKL